MSKQIIKKVPFLVFVVPYIYLSLLVDYHSHSPIGFIVTLILTLLLGFYSKYTNQLHLLAFGNIVSSLLSYYFCLKLDGRWDFVYQPFNPQFLVILFALLFICPQIIGICWGNFFTARNVSEV